jgi:hypothetical protein
MLDERQNGQLEAPRYGVAIGQRPGEGAGAMFNLLGVTLLQPETILSARMPESATRLGAFVSDLKELLRDQYDEVIASGARTLCVALAPGPRFQIWLAASEDESCAQELRALEQACSGLDAPRVVDGLIALALVFSIGSEPPVEAELTLPDDWRAIIQASDTAPSVEQIITRLWAS